MKDIGEIKTAISSFRQGTTWLKLRKRWEDDFDLYRLKSYNAGAGYYSYTSNAPRVLADKIINMLCEAALLIRIPIETLTEEQEGTAADIERFLYGSLNLNDEKFLLMPNSPPLREQMAWYATLRGSIVNRVYVHKDESGETFPEVVSWDVYSTAFGLDENGLIEWAARTYRKPGKELVTVALGDNEVVEFWDKEKYGVFAGNEWTAKLKDHKLGYCPVFIQRVGSMPPVWQNTYQFTGQHIGESIYSADRGIYPMQNKTLSDWTTLVRRGVKVPMGYWSAGGQKTLDEDIWQVDKAPAISLDSLTNEKLEPIMAQTMPTDAAPFMNWVSGEIQRGGLSHLAMGELGFRLSGFAINQLNAMLSSVVSPFAKAIERAYLVCSLELTKQYSNGSFKPVAVRGRTSKDETFGYPEAQQIKPSEVKGSWHPEVKLEPSLPKDDAQKYILANYARDGEVPLLSDQTIQKDLLGIRDPNLESSKIDKEWADKLLINRLYDAYLANVEEGRPDKAENVLKELQRYLVQTGQTPSPQRGGGAAPGRLEAASAGATGSGAPPGGTGVPSSVMPSEALGGLPGGAIAGGGA